jgi:hypothetical protein
MAAKLLRVIARSVITITFDIERALREVKAGRVEFKGTARSITRVGDKFEEAIVPFNVVAVDGGPGFERDSLLLTVLYNEKDSPMQLAIFGPAGRFGHSILSGDIAIARN